MEPAKVLGQRIRKLREDKNLTQDEVAIAIGEKRSSYAEWENGTQPKIIPLLKIVAFFKINIEDLVHGLVDGFPENRYESRVEELFNKFSSLEKLVLNERDATYQKVKKKTRK